MCSKTMLRTDITFLNVLKNDVTTLPIAIQSKRYATWINMLKTDVTLLNVLKNDVM